MKLVTQQLKEQGFLTKHNTLLKDAFLEARKEETFAKLIKKLSLPDELLMKYTSSLQDSAAEYHNCMQCKGLVTCKNKISGFAYLPKQEGEKLLFGYQACKYQKNYIKETEHLNYIFLFHLPEAVKDAQMKDIYTDNPERFQVIKWIRDFIKTYPEHPQQKGLYLHGNFGCGKSYLISAMFHEFAKQKISSAIIFWPEYLNELKSSFNSDFKERNYFKEKMNFMEKVPLLLIDDIGAENMTPWSRDEVFCPLIQYRMDAKLPTFFTSNLDLEALERHFAMGKNSLEEVKARRIIERIKQLSEPVEMVSKNLRN